MTFFYVLLAFIVGLLLGWFLWGRLHGELAELRSSLEGMRGERDKLKADTSRLNSELVACGSARADLERQLAEEKAASVPAAPAVAPVAAIPSAPAGPKKSAAPAPAKSANVKTAKAKSAKSKPANMPEKDNLRRLIGIGPVNERKLNDHGVTTFAQIAAWTAADIRSVEEYLEFDGRIKRERWVQQAKLLAVGNEKEFVRRFPTAGSSDNT